MGRFKYLVKSFAAIEVFKAKYHIPEGIISLRYCSPEKILTDKKPGEVVIPVIAFIEGGMTIPIGEVTQEYLRNHRLFPHQCAPNIFRVLRCVDALNQMMGLQLTWHDVVHMYECHSLTDGGYYLKSRSPIVKLVSCLPKSNKGMKDDYVISSGEWHNSYHCPTKEGELAVSTNKKHVGPKISLVNVAGLNKLLRSEIFTSEDGQLRAVHLVLDFVPLSNNFQEVGNAIRAGDPRIHKIDVSRPGFLAKKDLPLVEWPLQQALPQPVIQREETASSRLSLEAEIV